jgi:hypothetical protein
MYFVFSSKFWFLLHITFQVGDVFAARISETEGFAGLQKCGGTKCHKGR